MQNLKNQTKQKDANSEKIRFVIIRFMGWVMGKLDEGDQQVQTSSCNIYKY